MDNIRLALVVALSFLGLMLWQAWEQDYGRVAAPPPMPAADTDAPAFELPATPPPATPVAGAPDVELPDAAMTPSPAAHEAATEITIVSDVLALTVSSEGGNLVRTALRQYPLDPDVPEVPVELLGVAPPRIYVAEGGLAGDRALPNHHSPYRFRATHYALADGADRLVVPLTWQGEDGVTVEKRYVLERGSYEITIEYVIDNGSEEALRVHDYAQLKRNEESSRQGMVYTYTGAVLSTPEQRFEKYDLDDLEEQPLDVAASDAWVGIMQHYFVSALIPPAGRAYQFYSKVLDNAVYLVGFLGPAAEVAPGAQARLAATLFIGPKRHDLIESVTPGLELTVDYGILWFIAKPLFVVLRMIHDLIGNWGWAIVILTILLKLVFYPLSAAGYRSMANMRRVQPRMLAMRDRYKDDRAQLNQAMMQLYKEEKINPLGGCLPILIQIPVFIALYWVLLESVEMRQAPFILWINDLSTRDPLFVLPLLMGISMWGQQKLNPAPLDPTQAKVMQILPFVFTVFFAFFPAGLVLYWLVNNILSIAQQWQITRQIEQAAD